ncbi:MAG: LamG-like jellyroll fold domain-containing protein [Verrucomicrobiota bacterium]|nr:hypothetical protein [Limisphaera sp.]MDW8381151.1 LamG-like jellyroll fold domain-containing protein [Verrucomicrobiota bacterium]
MRPLNPDSLCSPTLCCGHRLVARIWRLVVPRVMGKTAALGWLVLGASSAVAQQVPCVPPPPGLTAWYPLDEAAGAVSVQDIALPPFSTVVDNGSPQPGPVQSGGPASVPGKVGAGALYFFGPYVRVPHSVDVAFAGDFTVDAWIRVVDCGHGGGGALAGILDKWDPNTQTGLSFFVDQPLPATGFLMLQWNTNLLASTNTLPANANPLANTGPWVHVAVTVDRANQLGVFYINGGVAGTFTPPVSSVTNLLDVFIGRHRLPRGHCELAIDELEVFNRALTAQEIWALYQADSAGKCRPTQQPLAQICVQKFLDRDGDGIWDPNETALAGWQFVVTDLASNVVGTLTTALPGTPPGCLNVPAGTYTVTEVLQLNWTNTTPLSLTVTLLPGQATNLVFGNRGCFNAPSGMVGWWPLDDATNQTVVLDLAGSHNGTPKNSGGTTIPVGIPTLWQLPHPGVFGGSLLPVVVNPATFPPRGAFYFSDTYIEVPHHPSLNIGSNGWTLTLWVWPTMGQQQPQPLVEKFDLAAMNGYAVYLDLTGPNSFTLKFNLNGTVVLGPTFTTGMAPTDWRFVVVRISPTGNVVLGVCDMFGNCTSTAPVTVAGFLTTNSAPLWFSRGTLGSPSGVLLHGIRMGLDEVEMFNRALSQAELQSIYDAEVVGLQKCPVLTGPAELCIFKFHDLDGDGVWDPNEPGLSGWSFSINPAPPQLATNVVTTLGGGGICVGVSGPATYTITELPQQGWTNTTPVSQTVTIWPGQLTNVYFGNLGPTGRLCVVKFLDLDMNGQQGPNESLLGGWQFLIQDALTNVVGVLTSAPPGAPTACVTLPVGTYTVTEVLQPGWTNTTPLSQSVTIGANQTIQLSFGNVQPVARLCVWKFHDLNLNGVQDPGEPFLPGWTIQIKNPLGAVLQTLTTQTNPVCVTVSAPATYHISEVLPPPIASWVPWSPTVPPSGTYSNVTVLPGQSLSFAFGNRKNIKVVGWGTPSPARLVLQVVGEPGRLYRLQYRLNLGPDSGWENVGQPILIPDTGAPVQVPVDLTGSQRYFRIIEE